MYSQDNDPRKLKSEATDSSPQNFLPPRGWDGAREARTAENWASLSLPPSTSETEKFCLNLASGAIDPLYKLNAAERKSLGVKDDDKLYPPALRERLGSLGGLIGSATAGAGIGIGLAIVASNFVPTEVANSSDFGAAAYSSLVAGIGIAINVWSRRFRNALSSRLSGQVRLARNTGADWTQACLRVKIARDFLHEELRSASRDYRKAEDRIAAFDKGTSDGLQEIFSRYCQDPEGTKKVIHRQFAQLMGEGEQLLLDMPAVFDNFKPIGLGSEAGRNMTPEVVKLSNAYRSLLLGLFLRDKVDEGTRAEMEQSIMSQLNRLDGSSSFVERLAWRGYPLQSIIGHIGTACTTFGSASLAIQLISLFH